MTTTALRWFLLLVLTAFCCAQVIEANVYFRFSINFGSKDAEEISTNSADEELFNKSRAVEDETTALAEETATVGPGVVEIWARQHALNEVAVDQMQLAKEAIANVNVEILPLVGRSDFIASKVKLTTRYLNEVTTFNGGNKFKILRKFVDLVEELEKPPSAEQGGSRSMASLLMKLVLDKYDLLRLKNDVRGEVLQAEQTWQNYVKTKLVEVSA